MAISSIFGLSKCLWKPACCHLTKSEGPIVFFQLPCAVLKRCMQEWGSIAWTVLATWIYTSSSIHFARTHFVVTSLCTGTCRRPETARHLSRESGIKTESSGLCDSTKNIWIRFLRNLLQHLPASCAIVTVAMGQEVVRSRMLLSCLPKPSCWTRRWQVCYAPRKICRGWHESVVKWVSFQEKCFCQRNVQCIQSRVHLCGRINHPSNRRSWSV